MGKGKDGHKKKKEKKEKKKREVPVEVNCPTSLSSSDVRQLHIILDLDVNFDKRTFSGKCEILFECISKSPVSVVCLDSRDLVFSSVCSESKELLAFRVNKEEAPFGKALEVHLKKAVSLFERFSLVIEFETSPNAMGLQWLDPSLTEGKKHPYVFSQFQAIHARSFMPCQDTPSIKFTYDATIRCPSALTTLMSAIGTGKRELSGGQTEFYFAQRCPVPSYLVAIVVGNLQGRVVGPISTVWTEPEMLERAAFEFAEVDSFIRVADQITDLPYRKLGWGKYDLLVLPKSFPYGGMENTIKLTEICSQLTPTLLTGDRSAVSTVIHELAHSWFGNAITCRTWEHFWLNEGFTVWLERKIVARIHGEAHRDFDYLWHDMDSFKRSLKTFQSTPNALSLVTDLTLTDPDDYFSTIPYEKGSQFLYWLEKAIVQNSHLSFEGFVQSWIRQNVHKTVTSEEFQKFFESYYAADSEVVSRSLQIPWHAWFYDRDPKGCPVDVMRFCDSSLATEASNLAKLWADTKGRPAKASENDLKHFSENAKLYFLRTLFDSKIDLSTFEQLEKLYQFQKCRNPEVRFQFLMLALSLKSEDVAILANLRSFLSEQGRMKFTRPLYTALKSYKMALAREIFAENKSSYHPVCAKMVMKDLDGQGEF